MKQRRFVITSPHDVQYVFYIRGGGITTAAADDVSCSQERRGKGPSQWVWRIANHQSLELWPEHLTKVEVVVKP